VEPAIGLLAAIAFISFACEYMDVSIGMGYGTVLSPLLLIMGFHPLTAVPAVLLGQIVGGIVGGLTHYKVGNVQLKLVGNSLTTDAKVIIVLTGFGLLGAISGVFLAVSISEVVLCTYIGLMVLAIGIIIIWQRNKKRAMSWTGLMGIAIVSAFNKSISGGGYGPLVTSGQIVTGRGERNSVGSTTICEVAICTVGFISYLVLTGDISWQLAIATSCGSVLAAPLGAITISRVTPMKLKVVIGITTIILGVLTLGKAIL